LAQTKGTNECAGAFDDNGGRLPVFRRDPKKKSRVRTVQRLGGTWVGSTRERNRWAIKPKHERGGGRQQRVNETAKHGKQAVKIKSLSKFRRSNAGTKRDKAFAGVLDGNRDKDRGVDDP